MNDQIKDKTLESIFKRAAKSIDGLPEDVREKAFELAVIKLSDESLLNTENNISENSEKKASNEDFFQLMKRETGITEESLKSIYKLDKKGELKIVASLTGKTADKQRLLAYLYLLGMKLGFTIEWIPALKFAERAKDYGANDGHISKNLRRERGNILQEGRKRGKEYSLTPNGVSKAKELLNSFT